MDFADVLATPFTYPDNSVMLCKVLSDNSDTSLNYPNAVSLLDLSVQNPPRIKEAKFFPPSLIDKMKTTCSHFECD